MVNFAKHVRVTFRLARFFHARVDSCEHLSGGTLIIDTCAQFVMFGGVDI